MRNYLFNLTFLLCFLFISTISHSQLPKIYLHPKAAGNGKQSQFVDSIRFIPLEIKEGIQVGTYNKIEITEKYFLIMNYQGKTILVYSRNGRFVKKVSYKKLGDRLSPAYDKLTDQIVFFGINKNYALTEKDMMKITLDWNNPSNKKYFKKYTIDLKDTSFVFKKAILGPNDIIGASRFYEDFYTYRLITTSPPYKDSLDYELKIYKNNQLVKGFFPYNRINETKFLYTNESTSLTLTDTPYINYVTRPYCDTIYKMIRDSLSPLCQIVLPLENSLPTSFFTKPFKNKTERENFGRNNGWMLHQVIDFYETPRFIHLSVWYLSNYDSYIYYKQTGVTYKTKNIKADSSQYNLQLLLGNFNFNILRKGDKLYKTQKAGDLITFFAQNKNVAVPKELEDFLKSNPPATAPIIVEFKLKN
jgi:hypothetical protein